jgi:hypothetical protein
MTTSLLAKYKPSDDYICSSRMPFISITPRRMDRTQQVTYNGGLFLLHELKQHCSTPLLRCSYRSIVTRKSHDDCLHSISPGPAAYPMYTSIVDVRSRLRAGFTQKHRLPYDSTMATSKTMPPFYSLNTTNLCSSPAFSIGQRRYSATTKQRHFHAPYYESTDRRTRFDTVVRPGATLKGRWSSSVYMSHYSQRVVNMQQCTKNATCTIRTMQYC